MVRSVVAFQDQGNSSDLTLWAYHGVNILISKVLGDSRPPGMASKKWHLRPYYFFKFVSSRSGWARCGDRRSRIYATDKLLCMFIGRPPKTKLS